MGLAFDTSKLSKAMYDAEKRIQERGLAYAQTAAKQLEASAKADAPWRDHTSHARGGITGSASRSGGTITITLSGSVRYMVYLELAHGKKWAVLWPTMQKNQSRILRGFAKIGGLT